ncbi:hypothetical protein H5410_058306 [Solanum commersonii]|uniref:Uncharacterized protein n=1 Tax=Solanum commersonii TaxID=4109 RepID=A0A9J5WSQ9_SOLCO|nr:hypothetical protein H5410_058306 [Solanum commersonii]
MKCLGSSENDKIHLWDYTAYVVPLSKLIFDAATIQQQRYSSCGFNSELENFKSLTTLLANPVEPQNQQQQQELTGVNTNLITTS